MVCVVYKSLLHLCHGYIGCVVECTSQAWPRSGKTSNCPQVLVGRQIWSATGPVWQYVIVHDRENTDRYKRKVHWSCSYSAHWCSSQHMQAIEMLSCVHQYCCCPVSGHGSIAECFGRSDGIFPQDSSSFSTVTTIQAYMCQIDSLYYRGYNDKKEKEPQLSSDGLQQHIERLSGILMQPWMSGKRFEVIRGDVEKLVDALHKYREYLVSQCEKVKSRQQSLEPRSVDDHELEQKLSSLPLYQPLFLNDIAPADRFDRRKWLSGLFFPFATMIYKYAYENNLGTLTYAWRIPEGESVDSTVISQICSQLCRKQFVLFISCNAQGLPRQV